MQNQTKNPLKMFGSYLGLILGAIGAYFSFGLMLYLAEIGKFTKIAFLIPSVPLILGFLTGWGAHLLIRKIKSL